jgi:hypothetical protein
MQTRATATLENPVTDWLQFTSAGHVLGFSSGGVMIAFADHLLKTEFMNASPIEPNSDSAGEGNRDFSRVAYYGLWKGVDLVYETSPGTILKSSYLEVAAETRAWVGHLPRSTGWF